MFHSFDVARLCFDEVCQGRGGGQGVKLVVDDVEPPRVQTPRLNLLWGVNVSVWGSETKRSVELGFRDTASHAGFLEALRALDARVLATAYEMSEAWFRRRLDVSEVERHYSPSLRTDSHGEPIFRLNVPAKQVLDEEGRPLKELPARYGAGRSMVAVVQPQGIWFFNAKFGVRWKVHEMRFSSKDAVRPAVVHRDNPCLFCDD